MKINTIKRHKSFNGETVFASHYSKTTQTEMKFSYFHPGCNEVETIIIWLSGLTCTEENFITKAGAQFHLKDSSSMIVCPDTSPRGLDLPEEHSSYDFGSGAGFYLNALTDGYKDHYRMYDYIVLELIPLLQETFLPKKFSISGHSMGGHGALVLGLKQKDFFHAISAFSPIVNPMNCPWGQKAFSGYLGEDKELWKDFDSCELIKSGNKHHKKILVDQGLSDEFYPDQLLTKNLEDVCQQYGQEVEINYREGHDHSYYFISSFIKNHIDFLV